MIKPYGSEKLDPRFVMDGRRRAELLEEGQSLPGLEVCSAAAANAVMLGSGYFNPLVGFMNKADVLAVAEGMHNAEGVFFPVPIVNMIRDASQIEGAKRVALRDPNVEGHPVLAVMQVEAVEELTSEELEWVTGRVYGTQDRAHPGVAAFTSVGKVLVSGPIQVLNFSYFEKEFPETFRTAYQIREEMGKLGWDRVVAFQTRNPMHRAHEELCRMAHEDVGADGILIHMLLGKLKKGDIPADVRDAAIRKMVEHYFPPQTVLITGYGYDMLYAGPREALLHAVIRQNCGCSHLIVGRDHAGVGSYYGPFDAQGIFDEIPKGVLDIEIYRADHTAYSKQLGRVIMMKDAPEGHRQEDFVVLSGTKVREMLAAGKPLPPEFARPEVAEVLMRYYQTENAG